MNRVGHSKLAKRRSLQLHQILSAVVHSTADTAILPPSMLHIGQLIELGADLVGSPAFLGKGQISIDPRPGGDQLVFQALDSRGNLLVDLATDTRGAQEDGV